MHRHHSTAKVLIIAATMMTNSNSHIENKITCYINLIEVVEYACEHVPAVNSYNNYFHVLSRRFIFFNVQHSW